MRTQRLIAFILIFVLLMPAAFAIEDPPSPQFGRRRGEGPPPPDINDREHVKARNQARQKELKADTEKLLELATELKQYVDKTNESVLSVEVIHKAEEIEKLAKSVREKMRGQ
jgi:hypothetical protein